MFTQSFTSFALLLVLLRLRVRGYHPLRMRFPAQFHSTTSTELGSSAFARHYSRNPFFSFFSYGYLDVSVPRVFVSRRLIFNQTGYPIRTSPGHSLFATYRSFSQLITSFVISESLGIPHKPLIDSFCFATLNNAIYSLLFSICQLTVCETR